MPTGVCDSGMQEMTLNPIALRMAKTLKSFGQSSAIGLKW